MRHIAQLATSTMMVAALLACTDGDRPTAPVPEVAASQSDDPGTLQTVVVRMLDRCDPTTFNAAIGPGTCVFDDPGVTFQRFLQQIEQMGKAPAWKFEPRPVHINVGETLTAVNLGGEVHTFTEVEEFGGGIVRLLNDLAGLKTIAPECRTLAPSDFIPAGGSTSHVETTPGVERYMCCIHPWMKTTVHIH